MTSYRCLVQTKATENRRRQEGLIRIKAGLSIFGKYREIFQAKHLLLSLKRSIFNQCVLPASTDRCQTLSQTVALIDECETNQQAVEGKKLNVKLKGRIQIPSVGKEPGVTDIAEYVTKAKWIWAGYIA